MILSENQPLISVIIPCYNVSEYVENAIHSILRQSYSKLEIWIIDDASTDDTLIKIKGLNDPRIKVVAFKENTQKVGAVNIILNQLSGDYICFQDADDWSDTKRIELQLEQFMTDSDLGICFTNYRYIGRRISEHGKIALDNQELRDEFLGFMHNKNNDIDNTVCGTMMISRAALQRTGGYHPYFTGRVAEDIHWIYRILKIFKGITVDKVLYNYTVREGSFTQLQQTGTNAKYAYSWQLLSKIIYKDVHERIDILQSFYTNELKAIELLACEEALIENIKQLNLVKFAYESSYSYRIGKTILKPFQALKFIIIIFPKILTFHFSNNGKNCF
jgi:glycosyltransferase involved in cell wall biosynthesis